MFQKNSCRKASVLYSSVSPLICPGQGLALPAEKWQRLTCCFRLRLWVCMSQACPPPQILWVK